METIIKPKGAVIITEQMVAAITAVSYGKTAKEVAQKQKVSSRTVESWILSLRKAYKCRNVTHLVSHLMRLGVIK